MGSIKDQLREHLTPDEQKECTRAFDVIGDIAIIELRDELEKKEELVAKAILDMNKNIKVVCRKDGTHTGTFRTQKLKIIGGEKRKETLYKENGVLLKLNVEEVYFSPRLANERLRIAKQVQDNEKILCLFSGCGPYPLVIMRQNPNIQNIVSIEINPIGVEYQKENLILNKSIAKKIKPKGSKNELIAYMQEHIKVQRGDVKEELPKIEKTFDRICMPLPMTGDEFLEGTIEKLAPGGILHYYDFLNEKEINECEQKVKNVCTKANRVIKEISTHHCGSFGPGIVRVCVDAIIE